MVADAVLPVPPSLEVTALVVLFSTPVQCDTVRIIDGEAKAGRAIQWNAGRAEGFADGWRSNHCDRSIGCVTGAAIGGAHLNTVVLDARSSALNLYGYC